MGQHHKLIRGNVPVSDSRHQVNEQWFTERVARLMRGHQMKSQSKRRFRVALTDSNHDLPIAPNRLRGATLPARADAVWVADITYVPTDEGWLYLAGVLDRHTRRCVGWAMSESRATSLPLAALDMALQHRQPPAGLVHHSDRGVQYASEAYRHRLAAAGVRPSMSRRGNCYDNAAMESFWSSLKRELVYRVRPRLRPAPRSSNGSKSFTTGSGSTAPWATSHLWTLKHNSTKKPMPHAFTTCPPKRGKASQRNDISYSTIYPANEMVVQPD